MNRLFPIFLVALLSIPSFANAQSNNGYTASQNAYLVPSIGYFDVVTTDDTAVQFGLEYRFASRYWNLRPVVGINVSTDESIYGYGGVYWDIDLWQSGFFFSPNLVAGFYEDGDGLNLGGTVAIRTGVEVSYDVGNRHRVGVAFNHISNAGIYDRNPGAETILFNYQLPF